MKKAIVALLVGLGLFALTGVSSAAEQQRAGFSMYLQHYKMGSPEVLIFETHSFVGKERFGVAPEFVDENVEMLNKFLKWAAMARERGDAINKPLDTVKGFDYGAYYYYNRYEFTTSESKNYHLKVTSGIKLLGFKFTPQNPDEAPPPSGVEVNRIMSFNEDQVKQIIQLMLDFKAGKLKSKEEIEKDYK